MERHRAMYKSSQQTMSPRRNENLAKSKKERSIRRNDVYSNSRMISIDPTPKKPEPSKTQKENVNPNSVTVNSKDAPVLDKKARQEAYLQRYIAWKQEKEKERAAQAAQKKKLPFTSSVTRTNFRRPKEDEKSFAPDNHVFRAPQGLADPTERIHKPILRSHKVEKKFVLLTPAKSKPAKTPIGQRLTEKALAMRRPLISTEIRSTQKPATTAETPSVHKPSSGPLVTKPTPSVSKPNIHQSAKVIPQVQKPRTGRGLAEVTPSLQTPQTLAKVTPSARKMAPPISSLQKPPTLSKFTPSAHKNVPPVTPAMRGSSQKRANPVSAPTCAKNPRTDAKPPPLAKPHSAIAKPVVQPVASANIKKSTVMKPKVQKKAVKHTKPPILKVNIIAETPVDINIAETPRESENPFSDFLTSTRRKSSVHKSSVGILLPGEIGNSISPIEANALDTTEPAKTKKTPGKNLFEQKTDTTYAKPDSPRNFKFVRYSDGGNLRNKSTTEPGVAPILTDSPREPVESEKDKTPERKPNDRSSLYLSPFVSVSRGKVSAKKEKDKRNSVYIPETNTPEETPEYRRTMETVRYFRLQVQQEIDRLHGLCDEWENYKLLNLGQVEDNGIDMINVTIGQTRLLTSKKFKQFSGLIDRCENGAKEQSKCKTIADSDAAKPILPEDLEGFWCMVGLQIENVDKRFENLNRWKSNNWRDPDEVKEKVKKNLTKVSKAKTRGKGPKANSALQEMLRKAQAAYKQSKKTNDKEFTVLTPSRQSRLPESPKYHIAVNAVRKSLNFGLYMSALKNNQKRNSGVALTPSRRSVLTPRLSKDGSGKKRSSITTPGSNSKVRNSVFKAPGTPLTNKKLPRSPATPATHSNVRKSILKTPGTRGKGKSVIWNDELDCQSPPKLLFTVDDDQPDEDITTEEDDHRRSYRLRTRRVLLRNSMEIDIPK